MKVGDLLRTSSEFLASCGVEDPKGEARRLLLAASGKPWSSPVDETEPLSPMVETRVRHWVNRRGEGREPFAYITGTAEFFGVEFEVTPSVLIPRPSTESLVEQALQIPASTVVDIGTGSGAIAILLALRRPELRIIATDLSPDALRIARQNAARHRVASRIEFLCGSLHDPLTEPVDLIVSNPPYIPRADLDSLSPEVKHEPRSALDGGPDGLALLRSLISGARQRLNPNGTLLVEFGFGQAHAVRQMALESGFDSPSILRDLDSFDRLLKAR